MAVRATIKNLPSVEDRYKAEKENPGSAASVGQALDPWYKTEDATVAEYNTVLQKYKTPEAIQDYGATKVAAWDKSQTKLLKEIAAVVVALRKQYTSNKGNFPDWNGSTRAYQDAVGQMYVKSGIPARHVSGLRNALYYHINNLVVAVAPRKELETLGMLTTSRKARQAAKKSTGTTNKSTGTNNSQAPASTATAPVVVGGVEVPKEEEKGNQAQYLMMVTVEFTGRVLEAKDLLKADKKAMSELLKEAEANLVKIGEALSEAAEKANKRREQAARRRAAAAEATRNDNAA